MRRSVSFGAGFAAGVLATLGSLALIGHAMAVEDPLAPADAIVALSGDTGARAATAADLWKRHYAPVIIFSGASGDPTSLTSAELMKRDAVAAGVPESAILVEPEATSTSENATRVAALMRARGLRTAILVTSPYHERRASILFEREFAKDRLAFKSYPSRETGWDPDTWWLREPSRSLTMVELAKLAVVIVSPERTDR